MVNPINGIDHYSLDHARRLVRQNRAAWEGPRLRWLVPNDVASQRAAGIPAVDVRKVKPRQIRWPAQLTVIERVRQELGNLNEDPTDYRSFARYPDARSIDEMRGRSTRSRAA